MLIANSPELIRHNYNRLIFVEDGVSWCRYRDFTITSAFQGIFTPSQTMVGIEALARPFRDDSPCSPLEALTLAKTNNEQIFLDRLLRAVHLRNVAALAQRPEMLFLNHDIDSLIDSASNEATRMLYQQRIIELGLAEMTIVAEILEQAASDEEALALSSHQRRVSDDEQLALDDVVDCELAVARIQRIQPDIIKLDMSVLRYPHYAQFIARLRSPGVKIVQEGIETAAELAQASRYCDLLQGYFLHRPALVGDFRLCPDTKKPL